MANFRLTGSYSRVFTLPFILKAILNAEFKKSDQKVRQNSVVSGSRAV